MVVGFALRMEKNCRHKTSKKCSLDCSCYNFWEALNAETPLSTMLAILWGE